MKEETKDRWYRRFGRFLNEGGKSFKYGFIIAGLGFVSTYGAILYEGAYLEEPPGIVRAYDETKKTLDNLQSIKDNFKFKEGEVSDLNKTIKSLEEYVSKTKDNSEVFECKEYNERVERNSHRSLLAGISMVGIGIAGMGFGLLKLDKRKSRTKKNEYRK
jgi:hypothetical protein